MKYLIGSIATAALLFVAVPGFACDKHKQASADETMTTAGAEEAGGGEATACACANGKAKKDGAACSHAKQKQASADETSGES